MPYVATICLLMIRKNCRTRQRFCPSCTTCNSRTPRKPSSMGDPYQRGRTEIWIQKHNPRALRLLHNDQEWASTVPSTGCWLLCGVPFLNHRARHRRTDILTKLKVPLYHLGIIAKFNGIGVVQSSTFKLSCLSYLNKVLDGHSWQETETTPNHIPMRNDNVFQGMLETAEPSDPIGKKRLQDTYFNYNDINIYCLQCTIYSTYTQYNSRGLKKW